MSNPKNAIYIGAAAVVLILVGFALYFYWMQKIAPTPTQSNSAQEQQRLRELDSLRAPASLQSLNKDQDEQQLKELNKLRQTDALNASSLVTSSEQTKKTIEELDKLRSQSQ